MTEAASGAPGRTLSSGRRCRVSANLVDLAQPRSTIDEVRTDQVDRAVAVRPDLVTLTLLDDAERDNDPVLVGAALGAVLDRLGDRTDARVPWARFPTAPPRPRRSMR